MVLISGVVPGSAHRRVRRSGIEDASQVAPFVRAADAVLPQGGGALFRVGTGPLAAGVTGIDLRVDGAAPVPWPYQRGAAAVVTGLAAGERLLSARMRSSSGDGPWSAPARVAPTAASDFRFLAWNDVPVQGAVQGEPIAAAATLGALAQPVLDAPAVEQIAVPVGEAFSRDLNPLVRDALAAGITRGWSVVSGALPAGLALSAAGVLSGTVAVAVPPEIAGTLGRLAPSPRCARTWAAGMEPLRGAPVVVRCTASSAGSPARTADITLEVEVRAVVRPEAQPDQSYRRVTWRVGGAADRPTGDPGGATVYAFATFAAASGGARGVRVFRGAVITGAFTEVPAAEITHDLDAGTLTLAVPPAYGEYLRIEATILRSWSQASLAGDVSLHVAAAVKAAVDTVANNARTQPVLWLEPGATYTMNGALYCDSKGSNFRHLTIAMNGATLFFNGDGAWSPSPALAHTSDKISYAMCFSSNIKRLRLIGSGMIRMRKNRPRPDAGQRAAFAALGLSKLAAAIAQESPAATTDAARWATVMPRLAEIDTLFGLVWRLPGNLFDWQKLEVQSDGVAFEITLDERGDADDEEFTRYGTFAPVDAPTAMGTSRWSKVLDSIRAQWPWLPGDRARKIRFGQATPAVIDESTNNSVLDGYVHVAAALPQIYAAPVSVALPAGLAWLAGATTGTLRVRTVSSPETFVSLPVAITRDGANPALATISEQTPGAWNTTFGGVSAGRWNLDLHVHLEATLTSPGVIEAKYQQDKPGGSPIAFGVEGTGYVRSLPFALRRGAGNPSLHLEGGFWFVASQGTSDLHIERCDVVADGKDEALALVDTKGYTAAPMNVPLAALPFAGAAPARTYAGGPYPLALLPGLASWPGDGITGVIEAGGVEYAASITASGALREASPAGSWATAFAGVSDAEWAQARWRTATRYRRFIIEDMTIHCTDGSRGYALSADMLEKAYANPWMFDPDNEDAPELATSWSSGIDRLTVKVGAATACPFVVSHREVAVPMKHLTVEIAAPLATDPLGVSSASDGATWRVVNVPRDRAGAPIPALDTLTIRATGFVAPPEGLDYGANMRLVHGDILVRQSLDIRSDMRRVDAVTGEATTVPAFQAVCASGTIRLAPGASGLVRTRVAGATRYSGGIVPAGVSDMAVDDRGHVSRSPAQWGLGADIAIALTNGWVRYDHDRDAQIWRRTFDPRGEFSALGEIQQAPTTWWVAMAAADVLPLASSIVSTGGTGWVQVGAVWTCTNPTKQPSANIRCNFNAAAGPRLIPGQTAVIRAPYRRLAGSFHAEARVFFDGGASNALVDPVLSDVDGVQWAAWTVAIDRPLPVALAISTPPNQLGTWEVDLSAAQIITPLAHPATAVVTGRTPVSA